MDNPVTTMISIILATKNGSSYIKRAINSVLKQSEKDIELIIVNDASTDSTLPIILELQKTEPRIKVISNQINIGPGSSRHKGILASLGDMIAFIDDDDEWVSSDKLHLQKEYLTMNPEVVLVGASRVTFISQEGKVIKEIIRPSSDNAIREQMLLRNPFVTSSVLLKKTAYLSSGGFSNLYLAEDYDLWMKLGKIGKLANIDGCDINYTVSRVDKSRSNLPKMSLVVISLIKKYKSDYPHYFFGLIKSYLRITYLHLKKIF